MPRIATEVSVAIGEVLREVRAEAGMTAQQVAEKVGCKQPGITMWEKGMRTPSISDLPRLAAAFRKSPLWLARRIFEKISGLQ